MPDRFFSREDVPWASGCFEDGGVARTRNEPQGNNPHERNTFAWHSWNAGWADMDAGLASDDYAAFVAELKS